MKSFYSIVYIHPNSLTAERYAVGLLLGNSSTLLFDFKVEKLNGLDRLYPSLHLKNGVLSSLKSIKQHIQQLVNEQIVLKASMFNEISHLLGNDYSTYLHNYSNGMIQFSQPAPVALEVDAKLFSNLVDRFIVGEPAKSLNHHKSFHQAFRKKITTLNIKDKVDLDYKLSPAKLEGIYTDTQVRLIGKNGVITAVQDIDFTINMVNLGQQLNEWEILVSALNDFSVAKSWQPGDYHVVFNKPLPKSPQEKLLNRIRTQKKDLFKLDSESEIDRVLHKIETSQYQPLSVLINNSK
ncbi:MAG: hypothetical protein WKF68_05500 [Daejeonella sp.]